MWIKDFDGWNYLKQHLHSTTSNAFYKERDIWWCSIGVNIGSEQDGHNERFERPVLILRGFSRELFLGVPISSKSKPGRHYLPFEYEGTKSTVLISQVRSLSTKRLIRKLHVMPNDQFAQVQLAVMREIIDANKNGLPEGSPRNPKVL